MMNKMHCHWCETSTASRKLVQLPWAKFNLQPMEGKELIFSQCVECLCYSQNPLPSKENLASLYDDGYLPYVNSTKPNMSLLSKLSFKLNPNLGKLLEYTYSAKRIGSTMIDVGAGTSRFGLVLKERGFQVTLVDISERLERDAVLFGMKFIHADAQNLSNLRNQGEYSIVHAAHVIEHVESPKKFLNDLLSLSEPGGVVHISFPCADSFLVKMRAERWLGGFEPRHLNLPSMEAITNWLEQQKEVEKVERSMEANPHDVARWFLKRYKIQNIPKILRILLMGFSLAIAFMFSRFGSSDRAHLIIRKRSVQ